MKRGGLYAPWSSALVLAFLSGYWMLLTINSAPGEFSSADFWLIVAVCAGGVAAQVGGYVLLYWGLQGWGERAGYRGLRWVWRGMPAVFAVVNFFCLHGVFLSATAAWSEAQLLGAGALALPAAFLVFAFVGAVGKKWRCGCVAVAGGLFAVQAGGYLQYALTGPLPAAPAGQTSAEEVRMVELKRHPNLYLVSFDAMAPEAITRRAEHLNMAALPYQRWMIEAGFRRFRNAFSDGVATFSSLNRLLAMHPDHYARLAAAGRAKMFSGMTPAPLFEILAANGYRSHTYYRNDYFGNKTGPHVDGYHVYYPFSICMNHPPPLAFRYGFFGYCERFIFNPNFLEWVGAGDLLAAGFPGPLAIFEFVSEDIRERLAGGGAHIFMPHFGWPDHPLPGYARDDGKMYAEYRSRFQFVSARVVPGLMQAMFELIKDADPEAIVLYYSDHGTGAGLRRDAKALSEEAPFEEHRRTAQDRYGILMGLYPADACAEYIDAEPRLATVATPSMVVRLLLRCLAEGEDPVPGLAFEEYGFFAEVGAAGFSAEVAPVPFDDFLYE